MLTLIKDKLLGKVPKNKRRSSKWRKVRKQFIKKHNKCAVCGSRYKLEVHHKIPFHIDPSLELDESNLITLCENKKYGINCHLLVGHRGSYRKYNPQIEEDIEFFKNLLNN